MKKCFIGLGSNERTAARLLAAQSDLRMSFSGIMFSRLVQTAPVGFDSPACFTIRWLALLLRSRHRKSANA